MRGCEESATGYRCLPRSYVRAGWLTLCGALAACNSSDVEYFKRLHAAMDPV
jgi:hypothetical protein